MLTDTVSSYVNSLTTMKVVFMDLNGREHTTHVTAYFKSGDTIDIRQLQQDLSKRPDVS